MSVKELITDRAIDVVFINTDFGGKTNREVVEYNLKSVKNSYHIGRTARWCLLELGLIKNLSKGKEQWIELTTLGKEYLRILSTEKNE